MVIFNKELNFVDPHQGLFSKCEQNLSLQQGF